MRRQRELMKRYALDPVRARLLAPLLHRKAPPPTDLRFADLRLDPLAHRAYRGERILDLTPKEFALLEVFLRHPQRVLTRTQVYEQVWGYDFGQGSNSLGVYIGYLRRKLESGGEPRLIHTVRGVGYALRAGG
jgi:two-component system, OmpR family, response regulator MprA